MKVHQLIGSLLLAALSIGCAGASVRVHASELKHPVSLSQAIYTSSGDVVIPAEASVVGHFSEDYSAWSILWTMIPLSKDNDIAAMLDEKIEEHGGDGAVNLKVYASEDYFFALTSLIPIMPHAVYYNIEGDVVVLP